MLKERIDYVKYVMRHDKKVRYGAIIGCLIAVVIGVKVAKKYRKNTPLVEDDIDRELEELSDVDDFAE